MNVAKKMKKLFLHDHWQIGIANKSGNDPVGNLMKDISKVRWHSNEKGHYSADPFIIEENGKVYVFFEDFAYRDNEGCLAYVTFDGKKFGNKRLLWHVPFQQSYPHIIAHAGDYYCLPEESASEKLTLYKAMHFPDEWEKCKTLIDRPCVDATVIHYEALWWLFCTMAGDRVNTDLHMFYAEDLLGPWHAHAANPVGSDPGSARPAGNLYTEDGVLYRPAQNCAHTYGGGIVINRITELTPDRFAEEKMRELRVPRGSYGAHTISTSENYIAIDIKKRASCKEVLNKYCAYIKYTVRR